MRSDIPRQATHMRYGQPRGEGAAEAAGVSAVSPGASVEGNATGFAVFSSVADAVDLCLFDEQGAERRQPLEADEGFMWRGTADGVGHGARYGFRVHGP